MHPQITFFRMLSRFWLYEIWTVIHGIWISYVLIQVILLKIKQKKQKQKNVLISKLFWYNCDDQFFSLPLPIVYVLILFFDLNGKITSYVQAMLCPLNQVVWLIFSVFSLQIKTGADDYRILQYVHGLYHDLGIQNLTVQIDFV